MTTLEENIKVGDICKLRNGLITEPIQMSSDGTNYVFEAKVTEPQHKEPSVLSWLKNGSALTRSKEHKHDIIEIKTKN